MRALVSEPGAQIVRRGLRLEVYKDGARLGRLRLTELEQLTLSIYVNISSAALRALIDRKVETLFISRSGGYLGRLVPAGSNDITVRHNQHLWLDSEANKLSLARRVVSGKIRQQRALILGHPGRPQEAATTLVRLRRRLDSVEGSTSLDELRGVEGSAAETYFRVFGKLIRNPDFSFEKRTRRPPTDPVNVLLSFGYMMLTRRAWIECERAHLEPLLGALHEPHHGRPSLALDFIEEFRPLLIDDLVLTAINTRMFVPADFESGTADGQPAVRFHPKGLRKWVSMVERRLDTVFEYPPARERLPLWTIIENQVRSFAKELLGEGRYQPLLEA